MSNDNALQRAADETELRALTARYGLTVDACDGAGFAALFLPDGRLVSYKGPGSSEVRRVLEGHDKLAPAMNSLRERYLATFHFMGQGVYDIDGDQARGIVYCIAHHIVATPHGPVTYVLYVRYKDSYRRGPQGWKFAERHVLSYWSETRNVNAPETYAEPPAAP